MKPSLLRIKGINSFNNEQIIEFSRLVEKGLFGIFGPTGSGKSSILDAITLALYGNISRDSKEFINTESEKGEVSFQFQILDGNIRKTYCVDRAIKRKKNGGIETSVARIIEIAGDETNVLAEGVTNVNNEVIRIIGLNSDDFTRSVVLPQGKFGEFLKLTGKERRNMLERIFGLEQYGKNIMDKINAERKKYDTKRIDLEGQLKGYEGITEDYYKEVLQKLEILLDEDKNLKEEIQKLDAQYEESKRIWDLQEELKGYTSIKGILDEKKEEIEKNKKRFKISTKANLLKPYISNLRDLDIKINNNKAKLESIDKELPGIIALLKTLEEKYEKAVAFKEKEFPTLIAKIENCKQAEEIENTNVKLAQEIKDLEEVYRNNHKLNEDKSKVLEKLNITRIELQEKIKEIEKYLDQIYIDPSTREELEEANRLGENIERLILEKEENKKQLEQISKSIEASKIKLDKEVKAEKELELKLNALNDEKKLLDNSPLKEEGIIFTAKIDLEKKNEELKSLKEFLVQKSVLTKEINELESIKFSLENQQEKYILDIQASENRVAELKAEVRNIEIEYFAFQLGQHLHDGESCPVCGSKEHPSPVKINEAISIEDKQNQLLGMEEMVAALKEEKTKVHINIAQITKELDIKKVALGEIDKAVGNTSIEVVKKEAIELEQVLEKLTKDREIYINNKAKLDEDIDKSKEELNNINNITNKLNIEIQKDIETYTLLNDKNTKLIKNIDDITISLEKIKKDLKIENIAVEYSKMKDRDKERSKNEKELKDLRVIVEEKNRQKENLDNELNSLKLKLVTNKQQVEEYKKQLNKGIDDIKRLAEGNKPKEYKLALENKVKEVEEAEKTLKVRVENGKGIHQKKLEEKAIAENNKVILETDYSLKKEELNNKATEQGFESIEDIEKHLIADNDLIELEKEITEYDDKVKNTNSNINRINKVLNEKELTEEAWLNLQSLLKDKKKAQEDKVKEVGETQQIVKDVKVKLENIKELKKEEKKITHKLDLLSELSKMLEGNRFVEYVAINQLKYIAKEASKWLKDITRSRYALELDNSGNFIMRDDFNGGIRRATNTLSGGETFLTSLSLALALSSHIQLKGSAPLEFFFLDEGFGTLDSDLLEIVMNALERLHSEKLSVGIISHVEELKNRIPIKLIVSPPEFGGDGTVVKIL